jgi:hypothetical protein
LDQQRDVCVDDVCGRGAREQLPDPAPAGWVERSDLDPVQQARKVGLTGTATPNLPDDRAAGAHGNPLPLCDEQQRSHPSTPPVDCDQAARVEHDGHLSVRWPT